MYTNIKTFEDACKALGYSAVLPDFSSAPEKHRQAFIAHYQLIIIAEAINEGWQPDWGNTNQRKFELWPDIEADENKKPGFGLAFGVYALWLTSTLVGSRLCFPDRERAKHCFETFLPLWEAYFLIDK